MPYKKKEDKAAQMRRYRVDKKKQTLRKERLLDQLSYVLCEKYMIVFHKIDKNAKLVDGTSRVEGASSVLHLLLTDKLKEYSLAFVFAEALSNLSHSHDTPFIPTAEDRLSDWVKALSRLVKHPNKKNEQLEDIAYKNACKPVSEHPVLNLLKPPLHPDSLLELCNNCERWRWKENE